MILAQHTTTNSVTESVIGRFFLTNLSSSHGKIRKRKRLMLGTMIPSAGEYQFVRF
jgi:hypothetical protein